MSRRLQILAFILRAVGIVGMFALGAVVMPMSWMVATHRWLGLGEMPTDPVVEYLARSLSAFYALISAIMLYVAADLERSRAFVRFLAVAFALLCAVFIGIDLAAGMPWWWVAIEGPPGLVVSVWMWWLAREESR